MGETGGPALSTPQRRSGLDAARFIAVLGIVWLHCWNWEYHDRPDRFGRFAVPFFVVSSVYMMCRSLERRRRGYAAYAMSRIGRLYLPFLAWSCVYYLLINASHYFLLHEPLQGLKLYLWFVGPAAHLWFLPFLLGVNLIFYPICGWLVARPKLALPVALAAVVLGLAWMKTPQPRYSRAPDEYSDVARGEYFANAAWNAMPSVFFGIFLAFVPEKWIRRLGPPGLVGTGALLILIYQGGRNIFLENLSGLSWAIFGVESDGAWTRPVAKFGRFAYGIYLAHYMLVQLFHVILVQNRIQPTTALILGSFVGVTLITLLIVKGLSLSRWTRWTIGII
jgi:peptidoglycan/LPS O-acetylase OafA/YrhL